METEFSEKEDSEREEAATSQALDHECFIIVGRKLRFSQGCEEKSLNISLNREETVCDFIFQDVEGNEVVQGARAGTGTVSAVPVSDNETVAG